MPASSSSTSSPRARSLPREAETARSDYAHDRYAADCLKLQADLTKAYTEERKLRRGFLELLGTKMPGQVQKLQDRHTEMLQLAAVTPPADWEKWGRNVHSNLSQAVGVQKLLSSHALVERLKLQLADIREELRRKEAQLEGLQRRSKAAARERAAVNADWQRVMELEESDARVAAEIERKTTEVDATAGRIAKLQSKQAVEQRKLEAMQKELQEVHRASKESLPMDLAKKRVSVLRLKTDALKAQVIDAEAAAEERALKQQEALTMEVGPLRNEAARAQSAMAVAAEERRSLEEEHDRRTRFQKERVKFFSAVRLQTAWRAKVSRKLHGATLTERRQARAREQHETRRERATLRLQSWHRGDVARKQVLNMRRETAENTKGVAQDATVVQDEIAVLR